MLGQFVEEIVVPEGSSVEANSQSVPPFSGRFQQLYSASEFGDFSAGGWIRDIAFRIDGPTGFGRGAVITNLQISLSTTTRTPDSLSPVFGENIGPAASTAFQTRNVNLLFAYSEGSPQPFNTIVFSFDMPFLYSPSMGNLLLDFQAEGITGIFEPAVPFLDAWDRPNDSVARVFGDLGSVSGTVDSIGLVTRFGIQPIPEPTPLALTLLFVAGASFLRWKRK